MRNKDSGIFYDYGLMKIYFDKVLLIHYKQVSVTPWQKNQRES